MTDITLVTEKNINYRAILPIMCGVFSGSLGLLISGPVIGGCLLFAGTIWGSKFAHTHSNSK